MRFKKIFVLFICFLLGTVPAACGSSSSSGLAPIPSESEEELYVTGSSASAPADMTVYADLIPPLLGDFSEFVGPWAYIFYAKDDASSYIYHDAGDGYLPKTGDLIITGDDEDLLYIDRFSKRNITGLGRFEYWFDDYAWNGHILYVAQAFGNVLNCCEGNAAAPGQELDADDPDYIYKSSVDFVRINFSTGVTLTEEKVPEKEIRAVIETGFPADFTAQALKVAEEIEDEFNTDPEKVRTEIMALHPDEIDWCGLYIHYLLLRTVYGEDF